MPGTLQNLEGKQEGYMLQNVQGVNWIGGKGSEEI